MARYNLERRWGRLLILAGSLAFVAVVFASLVRVEPVEVFDAHLKSDGGQIYVEGRVKNTGRDLDALSLHVRYFDGNGRPVAEETVPLNALRAGAETVFHSPPRPRGEIREFTVQVARGRNPYGN
jgi:hypothetical protein